MRLVCVSRWVYLQGGQTVLAIAHLAEFELGREVAVDGVDCRGRLVPGSQVLCYRAIVSPRELLCDADRHQQEEEPETNAVDEHALHP